MTADTANQDKSSMRPAPTRSGIPDAALPVIAVMVFVGLIEAATRLDLLPQRFFPPPSIMVLSLAGQVTQLHFWGALWTTLWTWAVSLGIAAGLAIPLGFAMALSPYVNSASKVVVEFLRPVPSVSLIPAAILILGVGIESKIFLAAFAAFWPILINTIYGVKDVEPLAVDTARAFGCGPAKRLFRVVLPAAMPFLATGLRIGSAVALIIVVTMEIVVGAQGLGLLIVEARQGANVEVAYALILAAGLLGWALNTSFAKIEARLLSWHPSHRRSEP